MKLHGSKPGTVVAYIAGYSPAGGGGISPGGSPYTGTAGQHPTTLYVYGGTVTSVATRGATVANMTGVPVSLGQNESVTIAYSFAPSITEIRH